MNRKLLLIIGLFILVLGASAKRVGAYCYFANNGAQVHEDDNAKVELAMENENLILTIYNKTSNTIYVDKEKSFVYNNDKIVTSLNYGTWKTTGNEEQSLLAIAPNSRKVLCTWKNLQTMFNASLTICSNSNKRGRFVNPETGQKEKFEKGSNRSYTPEQNPFTARGIVVYSTNKDFKSATEVTVSNHITDIVIDDYEGVKEPSHQLPYCQQLKGRRADYSFSSGLPWALTTGGIIGIVVGVEALVYGIVLPIALAESN